MPRKSRSSTNAAPQVWREKQNQNNKIVKKENQIQKAVQNVQHKLKKFEQRPIYSKGRTRELQIVDKKIRNAMNTRVQRSRMSPNVSRILAQLMLPYEAPLTRVRPAGNGAATVETALARNFITHEFDMSQVFASVAANPSKVPTYTTAGSVVTNVWESVSNKFSVVHLNDPYVLGIVPSPSGSGVDYRTSQFANNNFDTTLSGFKLPLTSAASVEMGPGSILYLEPLAFAPFAPIASYGKTHPVMDTARLRVVWLDASASAPLTVNATMTRIANLTDAANAAFNVLAMSYGEDQPSYMAQGKFTTVASVSTASVQILSSGYYAFAINGSLVTGTPTLPAFTQFSLSISLLPTTCVVSRHLVNYNLPTTSSSTSEPIVRSVQLNGSGLLLNNPAAKMSAGGKIWAVSGQTNSPWYGYTGDVSNKVVASNSALRYDGEWAQGGYGYIKPLSGAMLKPTVETTEGGQTVVRSYSVDPTATSQQARLSGINVWLIEPPTVSAGSIQPYAPLVYLKFSLAYEYTSTSQMVVLKAPTISSMDAMMALETLASLPNFTENWFHLPSLINSIREKVRGFVQSINPIAKTAASVMQIIPHPMVNEAGRALAGISEFADSI